jgi:Tol biopolymer transport system component
MKGRVAIALGVGFSILFSTILIDRARPSLPQLEGTLIYHRYSDYSAWDATMWMVDLPTGVMTQVGAGWTGMISPINAHFSADGQAITFMGSAAGLPENEWDVFVSRWKNGEWQEPINLTGPNGARDEDPKFSQIADTIIYKENGVLATVSINGGPKTYLTSGEPESSMPFYSPNGKIILFERDGDIFTLENGITTKMKPAPGRSSYYPIALDNQAFLYTRVQENNHDAIYKGFYDGRDSIRYFFNSTDWDTSDSYPLADGSRYIFYVSGHFLIPHGGYNLMVADLKKSKDYNIDTVYAKVRTSDINSDLQELGPAWTAVRFTK